MQKDKTTISAKVPRREGRTDRKQHLPETSPVYIPPLPSAPKQLLDKSNRPVRFDSLPSTRVIITPTKVKRLTTGMMTKHSKIKPTRGYSNSREF